MKGSVLQRPSLVTKYGVLERAPPFILLHVRTYVNVIGSSLFHLRALIEGELKAGDVEGL